MTINADPAGTWAAGIVRFMKERMLTLVFILMAVATIIGMHYPGTFRSLKATLPAALFMMLLHPMVYLNLGNLVSKKSPYRAKYLGLLTLLYVAVYPALTYLLFRAFLVAFPKISPSVLAGVVLIGLAPLPSSAPAFVALAGGKVQLSLLGVVWTFILSLAVMPLYASLILHTVIAVPAMTLVKSLLEYIITPLVVGQAIKYGVLKLGGTDALERLKEPLMGLALLGLYWMVTMVFGINGKLVAGHLDIIIVGAALMNLYFLIRMGIAYCLGKDLNFPMEQRVSLFYSAGSNMTISTAMAIPAFGTAAVIGTALESPFSDMILMILFAKYFRTMTEKG